MKKILSFLIRMILGFLLCASGTVMALNSKLGLSPWDVFHQGLAKVVGITIGQASILVGITIGSYLYIGCELGCGPRDGLMIVLMKHTGKQISLVRFCIEMGALIIGRLLGGFVGIGTLITVFGVGYCVQVVYKIFSFDVNRLKHRNIKQGVRFINRCLANQE